MICDGCRERRHEECRGGTWCDCQHQPPEPPATEVSADGQDTEPKVNWLRQG